MVAKASFFIDDANANSINASTYNSGSFKIVNNSTSQEKINKVVIDLSSSILPDLVFDPSGTAGDLVAKNFTVDSEGGTGFAAFKFLKARDGGFDAVEITFNSFDPGKTFTFSVDVDPTSIKGLPAPGPNESGSVSGLELIGTTLTVDFSDSTSYTGKTYRIPNSLDGSQVVIQANAPTQPTIQVLGLASTAPTTVSNANQTVKVSGTPGTSVSLLVMEAGLFKNNGGGFDLDPFEANSAIAVSEKSATIGTGGFVDIPITLTRSQTDGGLNHIVAVTKAADGTTSLPSVVQILDYQPNAAPAPLPDSGNTPPKPNAIRINAGGGAYTDSLGQVWSADQYFVGGNLNGTTAAIAATTADPLFQTERWLSNLAYAIPVANGDYTVKLQFAEIYWNAAGQRIFDVSAENQLVIDDLDILAQAGGKNIALDKSFNVNVKDGTLNLDFLASKDNAKVSAIEIIPANVTPAPTPSAIRINAGGGAYTDSLGQVWSADQYFIGGNLNGTTAAIAATTADPLFQTERWLSNLAYAIPVANGDYTVKLQFAEIYWDAAGQRIFDLSAENQLVIDDLDIFAQAGGKNIALEKSFGVNVKDGTLNLDFLASKDNAKVSAIEIIPVSATGPKVILQETAGNTVVTEGAATGDTYSLVLNTKPTSNVTINLAAGNQITLDKPSLIFTPDNWNIAQTVTVKAVDDSLVEGTQTVNISHTITTTDNNYKTLTIPNVAVTVIDNDGSPATGKAIRIDTGATKSYTDTKGQVWEADKYFVGTSNTYSTAAPIGKSEDDAVYQTERYGKNLAYQIPVANGNYAVNLHFAEIYWTDFNKRIFDVSLEGQKVFDDIDIFAKSKNAFFTGNNSALVLSAPTQTVTDGILNIDFAASVDNASIAGIEVIALTGPQVVLQQTGGKTEITEGGASDSYSLVLNSQPTADVTINLVPGNQISANKTSLTFTPANWNVAQTVTISAVNDNVAEGAQTANITHTITTTDSNYKNLTVPNLAVDIIDNDIVAVSFNKKTVASVSSPTVGAWGPDGRFYVGTYSGEIKAYTFDQNYNVTATQTITTIKNLDNKQILGIAFNPYDTSGSPSIYVAHSKLYANGGTGFPKTELSPYSGEISILEGADFSQRKSLITGLPVSNHDHGINALTFDNKGDLYINVGGNTNAGITNDNIGGIPESPFSAAILKAEISKSNFNGQIKYELPNPLPPGYEIPSGLTFNPADSQVFGDIVNVKPGVDVSVYASGLRNAFGAVYTTQGLLYATENGYNATFGDISTSATTQKPTTVGSAPDELNLIKAGEYYGHPNRNRGRTDNRQNTFYGLSDPSIPGVYTAPLTTFTPSTNGLDEYRATTFQNQMRGNLIAQQWNGKFYNIKLSADGTQVQQTTNLTGVADGLDIKHGPGGAIVGVDLTDNSITVALPNDPSALDPTVYDLFPWRAPAVGGNTFVIGGKNFGNLGNTQVSIGGQFASITSVSDQRIIGTVPNFVGKQLIDPNANGLLDLVVNSNGKQSVMADAFLPLTGTAYFV
ncbi:MAG: PQQ-dependent sugar dehydrogenase [Mojavia pulchra JT2-VF2]|jgi:glucose/arabinose dehydrogenase|uniref:PQQ-dependent sugar dehydrogenase n=1 Tax=Mojavia pulchra JT2-VF2 TaxID=287848 RepID=A0A951UFG3_9NOST|nr:PQQ-dependent sugar dehydrogenase [Mojavia pulchra JT2-VF2]